MKYPTITKENGISIIEGECIITFSDKNFKTVIFDKEGTYKKTRTLNNKEIDVEIEDGKLIKYSIY